MVGEIILKTDTTMVQKIILMLYSNIGILLLSNCGRIGTEPPIRTGKYIYINKSGKELEIEARRDIVGNIRVLKKGDSTIYTSTSELPFPNFDLSSSFPQFMVFRFDDGNCTKYTFLGTGESEQDRAGGVYNLKEYENYSIELVKQKNYTLRYIIDSTDYKKAVPCK